MTRPSHLQITFETADLGPLIRRPMTEGQFRHALAATIDTAITADPARFAARSEDAAAIQRLAQTIAEMPFSDESSWLGTFVTIADQAREDNLVPAGMECPRCNEDQMDAIAAQDDGDFRCDCGALYSGDTQDGGRPAWYQTSSHPSSRRYYVPSKNVYVSIPD